MKKKSSKFTLKMALCGLGLTAAMLAGTAQAQQSITIANYGGAYGEAMWKAIWEPAAKELGITINQDTLASLADVRAQVRSNRVTWDIGELTVDECAAGAREGLFEPLGLDASVFAGYEPNTVRDSYVLVNTASYVLGWNTDLPALTTWADFWDTDKFPGARALRDDPLENIIVALLADGVPLSEAYPPDVDRAFAKLEQIKPHISVWWSSGAQGAQLLVDGEVDYIGVWSTRASAAIREGAPVAFTWNQGVLIPDCLFIPKGAPNPKLARTVFARALAPDLQATLPNFIDASPVTTRAYENNLIPADLAARQATSPENEARQVWTDGEWWAENGAAVRERWSAFMLK